MDKSIAITTAVLIVGLVLLILGFIVASVFVNSTIDNVIIRLNSLEIFCGDEPVSGASEIQFKDLIFYCSVVETESLNYS